MDDQNWVDEYKEWVQLRPHQIKLLDQGAQSQSQAWLINTMWSKWKEIKETKNSQSKLFEDPWRLEL